MSTQTSSSVASLPIAHFHPSHWGDFFLDFTPFDEATQLQMEQEVRHLKEELKKELFLTAKNPVEKILLIDAIECLGVGYHFEEEIEEALKQVYAIYRDQSDRDDDDLYHVSTRFHILRRHGFHVACDVFNKFKDEKGGFMDTSSPDDVRGILSLYEASHVRVHGDEILDEAVAFTTAYLKAMLMNNKLTSPLAEHVSHALHQPLHKGIPRLESKRYISFYEKNPSHSKTLLRFAKLDFNLLQSFHRKELRDLARWWKNLHSELQFTRERSVQGYFWALGCYYEPQYALARKIFTKMFMVQQVLDDIYDAYGTFEQLELLTKAVKRWDYDCMAQLPKHIKCGYQALLETFDEAEQVLAKEGRSFCIEYAKEQMKRNCQGWFEEAKWRHQKYTPKYDEYMEVALVSIGHVMGIVASYLGMGKTANKEAFEWVCQSPMLVKASAIILRLLNDIGGHKFEQSRDHVASAIDCYRVGHGKLNNEGQIYEELEKQVEDAWKDVNQGMLRPYDIPKQLLDRILNFARVPEVMYKGRTDGYTEVNQTIKHKVAAVLIDPIPL